MLSYCFECRKNTENKNLKVVTTKKVKKMLSSYCAMCDSRKSKSVKKQEIEELTEDWGVFSRIRFPLLTI